MKKIFFVRHGETDSNVKMIFSGSGDNPTLTKKGEEQANQAGKILSDKKIEAVFVSPLKRTKQTASIIAAEMGFDAEKFIFDDRLVERGFGDYEGLPHTELEKDKANGTLKDIGEDLSVFHDRLKEFLISIRKRPESTVLVVSHGGVGRMFRVIDRELSAEDFHIVERLDNCEVDEFTI